MSDITIKPHTASLAKHINRPVSIADFAQGRAVSLEQRDDNQEYIVRCGNEFMEGPEVLGTRS